MLDKDIKQRINTARQILVGKVPDPKAQVEQITTALIYKFMDDMDRDNEELGGKAQFLTGELREYAWGRLMSRELSGMERWNVYTRALDVFSKSEQIPELFRTIFKGAYLPYRDPETLNLFLKEIHAFSYDNSENLGNAYEYLLSILGSQGDAGQFRTPRHIIDFIVEVVNPQKSDRILDPACGTAGFLISSYKHLLRVNSSNYDSESYIPAFARTSSPDSFSTEIQQNGKYDGMNLTPDDRKRIAKNMQGYDISPDMVRLSLVNLYLHNFPAPRIVEYDTLTYEDRWDEQFDVILANPPFMTPKGGIRPHKRFRVSANRAEVLFVDYIAEHLSVAGRAGVIVPEGIIFQTANAYKQLRKMLVEDNYLYAVVSLPAGVFQPYSGVKTSILFMDRSLAKKHKEILFVKVENDGFDLGAQRRRIDKNNLLEAFQVLRDWQEGKQPDSALALTVPKSTLAENGEYNLTGDRYREAVDYSNVKWPIVELGHVVLDMKDGGTPSRKNPENFGGEINWAVVKDIKPVITETAETLSEQGLRNSSAKVWPIDSVIISLGATIGNVGINKIPLATKQGLSGIVVDKKKILPKYLYYILNDKKDFIDSLATGVSIREVRPTKLQQLFKFPLPPLEVQQAIVAELDGYQKIIDGARQVVDNWKPHIKIDPNWPKVKLGEVCEVISGQSPEGKYYNSTGEGTPFYQGKSEFTEKFITKPMKWTTKETKIALKDDILMSVRAPVGPVNIAKERICIGRGLAAIRVSEKILMPLLFNYLKSIENQIKGRGGAVFDSINRDDIQSIQIPLPPIETQNQIVADIEAEQQMIKNNKKLIALYEQKIKDKVKEVWGE